MILLLEAGSKNQFKYVVKQLCEELLFLCYSITANFVTENSDKFYLIDKHINQIYYDNFTTLHLDTQHNHIQLMDYMIRVYNADINRGSYIDVETNTLCSIR